MNGRESFRGEKTLSLLTVIFLFFIAGQITSCAASSTVADAQSGPEPVEKSASTAETKGNVVNVTNYYSRPAIKGPKPGGGLAIFETENFVGSSKCAVCHEILVDKSGKDMSISGHWRSTMMANAAKDPLWQAKVSSEVKRNPALKKVIEKKCATCHMPMAWTQLYEQGNDQLIFDNGLLNPRNELHEAAMDGVSCSLCHQIQDKDLGQEKSFSGKFVIETGKKALDREIFGPYENPVQETMQKGVGFTPVFGPQTNDSALCATCHTLFTPFVDGQGNIAGEFPEQTPYLEWKHSDFGVNAERRYDIGENPGQGKICQECHMPHSEAGEVIIARWAPKKTEPKEHFSQHHFVGGNVFMLNILQDNITNLELSASTEKLEDTKERTMLQLQNETAGLALVGLDSRRNELAVTLEVQNKAGHKFPTGIPTRRTWIHFTVADSGGQVIFESGKPLADGRIAGNDADNDIKSYEPHYDQINEPEQVQIYEGVILNTDDDVTYTLLRAAKYAKDNRLLPKGFNKASAPDAIAVFGKALSDADFAGGSDRLTYTIDTSGHIGPYTVTARLLFTAVAYPFVKDLEKDQDLAEVNSFMYLYRFADKMPQEVVAIQATTK